MFLNLNLNTQERLFIKNQQVFRKDFEYNSKNPITSYKINNQIKLDDIVVISDYQKGLINKNFMNKLRKKIVLSL